MLQHQRRLPMHHFTQLSGRLWAQCGWQPVRRHRWMWEERSCLWTTADLQEQAWWLHMYVYTVAHTRYASHLSNQNNTHVMHAFAQVSAPLDWYSTIATAMISMNVNFIKIVDLAPPTLNASTQSAPTDVTARRALTMIQRTVGNVWMWMSALSIRACANIVA